MDYQQSGFNTNVTNRKKNYYMDNYKKNLPNLTSTNQIQNPQNLTLRQ